jgi:trehalose 6-phosphate synthase/phosphatase
MFFGALQAFEERPMVLTAQDFSRPDGASNGNVLAGRRLVIMSNRAPIRIVRHGTADRIEQNVGGVGTTFLRLLERHGGLWIAWSGGQRTPRHLSLPLDHPRFTMSFIELAERDVSQYYYGLCNRALWPLMHFMLSSCYFSAAQWRQYEQVNQMFAERASAEVGPGDVVWVQDFHLALVPRMLRARLGNIPIGVFWHTPFPPAEIYRVFPWRRELLQGMLGSDLIGFHTPSYAADFMDACERLLGAAVDRERGEVRHDSRVTRVESFPLGVPIEYFDKLAADSRTRQRADDIRRALRSEVVVLGVDRLDYTKGVLERLRGFERFLEQNPTYHRRVTLLLIAVPSRTKVADYIQLKRQSDEAVGRVIGRFFSDGWIPIHYLYTQFPVEDLVAYYQAGDIALITPLRDGLNLVAKEFVACRTGDDGVLILSEFAGAAEELSEALLVNPYDADAIAARLKQAVEMSARERAARMRALRKKVRANDIDRWSAGFLAALTGQSDPKAQAGVEARAD